MQRRKERRGSQLSKTVGTVAKSVLQKASLPRNINNYVHLLGKGGSGQTKPTLDWHINLRGPIAHFRASSHGPPGCFERHVAKMAEKPSPRAGIKAKSETSYLYKQPNTNSGNIEYIAQLRQGSVSPGKKRSWNNLKYDGQRSFLSDRSQMSFETSIMSMVDDSPPEFNDKKTMNRCNLQRHLFTPGAYAPCINWAMGLRGNSRQKAPPKAKSKKTIEEELLES